MLKTYIRDLKPGKITLWCYLIWYLVTVILYFDPQPRIWINSLGISAIIGTALLLSVKKGAETDHWQTFRLFMMPFGVSSFAALIKGKGFYLVFPSNLQHLGVLIGACLSFLLIVGLLKGWMAPHEEAGA